MCNILEKILLNFIIINSIILCAYSISYASNVRPISGFNRNLIRAVHRNSTTDSISLGDLSTSSQSQTLTFPMVLGVQEHVNMDGFGTGSGIVVNNTDVNGYTVKVDSTNGGKMTGVASGLIISYTLTVDGANSGTIPLTVANSPVTIISGLGAVTNELHPISLTHSALPLTQAADTYRDTLTFYLYGN